MTNLKLLLVAVLLVAVSLTFGSYIHGKFIGFSGGILEVYYGVSGRIKSAVNEHFNQAETIKALREENAELTKIPGKHRLENLQKRQNAAVKFC